jgi:hypothetical protein
MAMKKATQESRDIVIAAPKFVVFKTVIIGTSPYVSNNFSHEAREQMRDDMAEGETAKAGKKKRDPKDFKAGYLGSMHQAVSEGLPPKPCKKPWYGIPTTSFRAAMIRASSLCGVDMSKTKMCVFPEPDGWDIDGCGLVRITKGDPEQFESYVRTPPGAMGKPNITARARWQPGWEAVLRIKFDSSFLKEEHVANLLQRAGVQVGVGAGRPYSTTSQAGMGWGTFTLKTD